MKIFLLLALIFSTTLKATTSLVTDQNYLNTLLNELQLATEEINIIAFSFAIDDGQGRILPTNAANQVAQKLIAIKKLRGPAIVIRLFIEGDRSTAGRNKLTGDLLEQAGVIVKYGSTHAKGFSIDRKKVLFGSTNLTSQSMLKNNETNILSDDPLIVLGFNQFFENLISGGNWGSIELSPPMLADGVYKKALIDAINSAKVSLEFSIYYFNDADIENALVKAFQRGVNVRGYFNQREIPGSNLVERNRQTVGRMKKAGIGELYFALETAFTHSKYLIIDHKKIFLGTGNWNYSDVNNYRQLYVELDEARLANKLSGLLDEQIKTESN